MFDVQRQNAIRGQMMQIEQKTFKQGRQPLVRRQNAQSFGHKHVVLGVAGPHGTGDGFIESQSCPERQFSRRVGQHKRVHHPFPFVRDSYRPVVQWKCKIGRAGLQGVVVVVFQGVPVNHDLLVQGGLVDGVGSGGETGGVRERSGVRVATMPGFRGSQGLQFDDDKVVHEPHVVRRVIWRLLKIVQLKGGR
jgi:hypothetical protein